MSVSANARLRVYGTCASIVTGARSSPTVLGSVKRCLSLCPLPSAHNPLPPSLVMSSVSATPATTATSSKSRFQDIFQAALKSYQKQTKKDLLAHPLASQLQSCDSTAAILAILHDQVREFEKNSACDERLTKWLGPTVNVISVYSAAVSGGVSLVSFNIGASVRLSCILLCIIYRHFCLQV